MRRANTDRRCRTRLATRYPVQLRSPGSVDTGWVVDLSFGGMFVSCSEVKPPGTELELEVGSGALPLRGKVAWIAPLHSPKGRGMGITLQP